MIKVESVTYKYDGQGNATLKDVSFQVDEGAYIGLIGPNGCGKTTLLKHLNGLLLPAEGKVCVDGLYTQDSGALQEIRQRVGMIFQNPDNQIVGMSVEEDVAFGPGNLNLPPDEIRHRVQSALSTVGLEAYAKRPPHTLSGGEKQLVAIAGVLAMNPSYIALDEPTSFLDPSGRKNVLDVIQTLNAQGIAMIHVTHNMDEIIHADQVIVLEGGVIRSYGPPVTVLTNFEWLTELGLGTPKVTELMWRFKRKHPGIRHDILTVDEAFKEINSVIENERSSNL
jgi:biotin transport system ATP-binding protein